MHTVIPYFILYCDFLLNDPQIASPLAMFLHIPSAECSLSLIFQHEELLQSSRCPIHYICSVLSFLPLCSLQMECDEKEMRREISYAIKNIHGIR